MAKSRLTPDYIEWMMSLNANQALREIHKVNEDNKVLQPQQPYSRARRLPPLNNYRFRDF